MSPLNLSLDAPEFQILNSSSSVNDTSSLVTQLTSAVNEAINSNKSADDVEGLLWRLWNAVIATASRTEPESQEKLTQLLSAISQQEDLKDKEGKDVTVWEKRVWSDLPVFGAAVREIFNNDELSDEEEQTQWININAFLARLTSEHAVSHPDGSLDFSLYGIWSLRDSLECEESKDVPRYKIDTARAWMEYAGGTFGRLAGQNREFQGKMAAPGEAYAGKEWRGYNSERLDVWTTRLAKR